MYKIDDSIRKQFREYFKVEITKFCDTQMSSILNKFQFDVFMFDDYLHEKLGYTEEEHGSINDFLKLKHGEGAVELMKKINKL